MSEQEMGDHTEDRLSGLEQAQQEMGGSLLEVQGQLRIIMDLLTKRAAETEPTPTDGATNQGQAQRPQQGFVQVQATSQAYAPPNMVPGGSHQIPVTPPNVGTPVSEKPARTVGSPTPDETGQPPSWKQIEARLRAVEGAEVYGTTNAYDLCLVPGVVLPPKFKMPDFEKFNGTQCPRTHLTMYCRKLAAHTNDDKLLIHCFQESLTGGPLRWYIQLEGSRIRT